MDKAVLLAQLRTLLETAPDFSKYTPTSPEHHAWLAKGHALITRWNEYEAISFKSGSNLMHLSLVRDGQTANVLGIVHRAIADLELDRPQLSNQAFGPGDVYDFFKALAAAVGSATSSLFVVDPYLDDGIFDAYLAGVPKGVTVRLLASKHGNLLKPAVEKFVSQHNVRVEIRTSPNFHDRVLFIDGLSCWVVGQSLKDAAKAKPTYLVPLPTDVAKMKLSHYETIWSNAHVL
ncbi:MAG TPA: hypothetical protein VK901_20055 [Nitrospiraceae bacterium]|nr:hypothetical protein [Nitrospiraceae bacterium]